LTEESFSVKFLDVKERFSMFREKYDFVEWPETDFGMATHTEKEEKIKISYLEGLTWRMNQVPRLHIRNLGKTLPATDGIYRHFKGGFYLVLGCFREVSDEDADLVVFYADLKERKPWLRPLESWNSLTPDGGKRFTLIGVHPFSKVYPRFDGSAPLDQLLLAHLSAPG
jgi:hypothetical protein